MGLMYLPRREGILFLILLSQANEMHFINLDALGGTSAHIFYLVKVHSILFSPNVCLFWEIFLPFMHTLEDHLQGTFISKQYPPAGALQNGSLNPSHEEDKLSLEVCLPKAGIWVDAWGRRVGFFLGQWWKLWEPFCPVWLMKHSYSHLK